MKTTTESLTELKAMIQGVLDQKLPAKEQRKALAACQWRLVDADGRSVCLGNNARLELSEDGLRILAISPPHWPEAAAEIVRRFNAFEEMRGTLEAAQDFFEVAESGPVRRALYSQINSILERTKS